VFTEKRVRRFSISHLTFLICHLSYEAAFELQMKNENGKMENLHFSRQVRPIQVGTDRNVCPAHRGGLSVQTASV
jgi:hypothetical protein